MLRFTASGPLSTKTSDVVGLPLCAQHTQTKWRRCRTLLQRVMNNPYMSISAPQESTQSPASPPGRTLRHCPPACNPCCCMESLRPLGPKVSCRIRGIQHLTTPHEESSASACAGGLRPGLFWGSLYCLHRASLWMWGCLAPASHAMHAHYFSGYKGNLF